MSKERKAGGNGEARGRKERPRKGMSGLRGQRRVPHAPGAAESRSTEIQGPNGATLLRLPEPGPGTRGVRRPDHREAGDTGTEETQPEGSRIRRELGDRPERARG